MSKEVYIQVKTPMYIAGEPVKVDEIVQVSANTAKRLISNGSAVEAIRAEELEEPIKDGDVSPGEVTVVEETINLSKKTVKQLEVIVKEIGLELPKNAKKDDLIELIIEAQDAEE